MERGLLFAHLIEPTHVGTGEGLGTVDRPVFRESTTGYPTIAGSTLKGATKGFLRDTDWNLKPKLIDAAFGADRKDDREGNQGCLLIADFRLLFLPARSMAGTFAWTTSTLALARFERFLRLTLLAPENHGALASLQKFLATPVPKPGEAVACNPSVLQMHDQDKTSVVEGFVLATQSDAGMHLSHFLRWLTSRLFEGEPYWPQFFTDRAIVMAENDFAHLCRESLPVDANIEIDPKKGTTTDGSLRYTEFLPAETVMYSSLNILEPLNDSTEDVAAAWGNWLAAPKVIQLGAEESKGKGVSRLCYVQCADEFPIAVTSNSASASDEGAA